MNAKYCKTGSTAVNIAKENLSILPNDQKRILSKFNIEPQAVLLKNVPLWIVSKHKSIRQTGYVLILCVTVCDRKVFSGMIKEDEIKPFQEKQHFTKGILDFYYQNGEINISAKSEILTLKEAKNIWQKEKGKIQSQRTFTIFANPKPAFCSKTPLYIMGYHRAKYSRDVIAIVIYALSKKLVCRTYCDETWQRIKSCETGKRIEVADKRISITQHGFSCEKL